MRNRASNLLWLAAPACFASILFAQAPAGGPAGGGAAVERVSASEARGRARLLHEVVRGALQVMHRDFFDPDDRDRIPSSSLEDVFETVEEEYGVKLKWLGVNAKVMDTDHKASDEFERRAVTALTSGMEQYESSEGDAFRFVGAIRLHNACLKCHVPFRDNLETRLAGLSIRIPIRREASAPDPR